MRTIQNAAIISFLAAITISQQPNATAQTIPALSPSPPASTKAADPDDKFRPHLSLSKKLDLRLQPRPPLKPETIANIKTCIDELTNVENPDFGFSSTLSGSAFLPVPEQTHADMLLLTDHKLKASASLKALVEWGPDALPYLLQALDDKRPTKLVIKHDSPMGGMWFSNELDGNPVNATEAKALAGLERKERKDMKEYTVRVGDICFVAIGQIVGRRYSAVRYQPTAIIIINSPVEDADLCRRVRQIWSGDDPWNKVFDSFLTDYATQAAFNGESLDGWSVGANMQIAAAMRLLYYFPKEAAPTIADRLNKLDVAREKDLDDYMHRCVANGLRAKDFVEALGHIPVADVQQALAGVFSRTTDYEIMLAALPAVEDKTLIRLRIEAFLKEAPADEHGAYGQGYDLLKVAYARLGDDSEPLFQNFLRGGSTQRAYSTAEALQDINTKWSDAILLRLLEDRRPFDTYAHGIVSANDVNRLDIRVCDVAAEALCAHHKDLKFNMIGTLEALDKQIADIKQTLAKQP